MSGGVEIPPPEIMAGAQAKRIRWTERAFDLLTVLLLLPVLLPVALVLTVVVFLDSPGSVLYRARRIGLGGEPFEMLKFRTMRDGATGSALTSNGDDRFTPVGRFLAVTRLDELPQIWHVITGEMRLVGPRPEDPEFVRMFEREYREILSVPPGITGSTQLIHFADSAELDVDDPFAHYAEEIMPAKLEEDAEYVRTRSLLGDLRIVGATLLLPFRLATAAAVRVLSRHSRHTAITVLIVGLLVIAFAAAGGSAR